LLDLRPVEIHKDELALRFYSYKGDNMSQYE
jgi:hypothetical protein